MSQIVGQGEIPGEGKCKGVVEVKHFEKSVPLDDVEVAVGQGSDVGGRLHHVTFLPELISEYISFG